MARSTTKTAIERAKIKKTPPSENWLPVAFLKCLPCIQKEEDAERERREFKKKCLQVGTRAKAFKVRNRTMTKAA